MTLLARRFATRIGAIRTNRFARIHSQKDPYFHNVRAIRANRLKPAICNFSVPRNTIHKKGFASGTLRRLNPQKRPDVHKICLSIELHSPRKSVNFEDFLLILYSFFSFWALFGGGGNKFCGQKYGHPDFSELRANQATRAICESIRANRAV